MANLFIVSLDTTVVINILQEIIKILHDKMSKAINLYWFYNDASDESNSLNDHYNEHRWNQSVVLSK